MIISCDLWILKNLFYLIECLSRGLFDPRRTSMLYYIFLNVHKMHCFGLPTTFDAQRVLDVQIQSLDVQQQFLTSKTFGFDVSKLFGRENLLLGSAKH